MRRALLVSAVAVTALFASAMERSNPAAQSSCPDPARLIGAWQESEVVAAPTAGDVYDGARVVAGKAGPGMRVFSKGHYAYLRVSNAAMPRPDLPAPPPTMEQLLAIWGPVATNGGRYDVKCDTLNTRPFVAKNPRAMNPGFRIPFVIRLVGDSLWLQGPPALGTVKYVRLD